MTRDRALAGMALLIAGAILVLVFSWHSSTKTVVHERARTGPTLVVKGQALRPLRAKRTSAAKSPDSATPHRSGASTPSAPIEGSVKSPTRPGARRGPSAKKKHRTPVPTSKPVPAPQSAPSAPPAPSQPPPLLTVPVPSICTQPIHVGTCP